MQKSFYRTPEKSGRDEIFWEKEPRRSKMGFGGDDTIGLAHGGVSVNELLSRKGLIV